MEHPSPSLQKSVNMTWQSHPQLLHSPLLPINQDSPLPMSAALGEAARALNTNWRHEALGAGTSRWAQSSVLILQWTKAAATRATSKEHWIAAAFCEQLLLKKEEKSHGMNREHPSTSSQGARATLNPPQLLFHSRCTWHQVTLTVACEDLGVFLV